MQIIAGICIVFLCIGIAPTARGFSVHQRASSAIVSASHANTFSPKPNLGNRQYNRRHNRFPIEILNFFLLSFCTLPVNSNFFKKCDPCPTGIRCVPALQCPAHVRSPHHKPQLCDLPHGGHGYCCTSGRNFTDCKYHLRDGRNFGATGVIRVVVVVAILISTLITGSCTFHLEPLQLNRHLPEMRQAI